MAKLPIAANVASRFHYANHGSLSSNDAGIVPEQDGVVDTVSLPLLVNVHGPGEPAVMVGPE
jgi:hypothetical protein